MTEVVPNRTRVEALSVLRQARSACRHAPAERVRLEHDLSERLRSEVLELERLVAEVRETRVKGTHAATSVGVAQIGVDTGAPREARVSGDSLSELTASVALVKSTADDVLQGVAELERMRSLRLGLIVLVMLLLSLAATFGVWWLLLLWDMYVRQMGWSGRR